MSKWPVDEEACRARQRRLLQQMQQRDWELVVVNQPEHIQWLTGVKFPWVFQAGAALSTDGRVTLICPDEPSDPGAIDEVATYEAKWHSTLRNDQRQACDARLMEVLDGLPKRVAVEYSSRSGHLPLGQPADAEPLLYELRRRKDPDELAMMRRAIAATEKMYEAARQLIEPGVSELQVFNRLQAAAVEELGEMLTGTGNDYQCNSRGGPPRENVRAEAGQLYILDLGPAFRGYFADNCRTIAVTDVSDRQQEAWEHVTDVFNIVETHVRPGVSASEIFKQAQTRLNQAPVGVFNHHLGHGVGLFPHEAPHLNPNWDDQFEQGDVFTAEPGLYAPELSAGMRIENQYRVTADGVERLTNFSLALDA